jgi:PAS domain-containing protein
VNAILPGSRSLLLCLEEGSVVHRAETKWRPANAELRRVLDSVPTAIILFDSSGRMRFCNARFGQLFGLESRVLQELRTVDELREILSQRFREPESFWAPGMLSRVVKRRRSIVNLKSRARLAV